MDPLEQAMDTLNEQSPSPLNMMLAGTAEGVLMIEGETSSFLTEAQMVRAVEVAHEAVFGLCELTFFLE